MAQVNFSYADDFLEELAKDIKGLEKAYIPLRIHRGIVRLVYQSTPTKISPNITHLSVVATALVAGQVYRLEHYCGDLWRIESQDQAVHQKGKEVKKAIEDGCARLGLEVRGGSIEE